MYLDFMQRVGVSLKTSATDVSPDVADVSPQVVSSMIPHNKFTQGFHAIFQDKLWKKSEDTIKLRKLESPFSAIHLCRYKVFHTYDLNRY